MYSIVNDKGMGIVEGENEIICERRVADTIRSLVNSKGMNLVCVQVLHKSMLISDLCIEMKLFF